VLPSRPSWRSIPSVVALDPAAYRVAFFKRVVAGQLHIVNQKRPVVIHDRIVFIFHHNAAIHTPLHLHGFVLVRVVPKGAGIRNLETVSETFTGLNGLLHLASAIHGGRQPDAVPVYNGGFRKVVFHGDQKGIALSCFQQRTGDLLVKAPGGNGFPGPDLPVEFTGF
jgi:hypothetical protein